MSGALSPEDRLRLEELFEHAAELPQAEHAAFLEHECASNSALRVELARLLAGLAGEDIVNQAQPVAPSLAGTQIGAYKLLEKIGEGGMGEVYAADQLEPVKRRVALKVIRAGMDSAQVLARFEAERQALARMSHAHVAQVFDGGTTRGGRPYFVMEYVAGEPITEYCDRRKLSTRERIELFLGVCEGVQHAHQKGLIHRDLKPSNLLVTQQDGRAVPKIIDFGVARATTGRLAERTLHTMLGQVVGTLDYMSPEQADPTGVDIDTRSDIYSLGVVLYQLVSGLLPFDHSSAAGLPLSELQRAIREENAPTPSTRLKRQTNTATAIAQLHGTDERSLVRQLHGDLDWITLKALEKDPSRRYASASELAEDLRRHLASEPVLAGRPGALYRARKFVRRNRMAVIAGVLVTLAAGGGIFGILLGQLLARAQRPQADAYSVVQLEGRADKLWPPYPDKIKALVEWQNEALNLDTTLEGHRLRLTESRERALDPDGTEDLEPYSRADDLTVKSATLELFRKRMERELSEWKRAKEDEFIAKLEMEIPALEAERDARRTWSFASVSDSSRHAVLAELVKRLENLRDEETGLLGTEAISPEHGWSVPKRLAFAQDLKVGFAPGGVYAEAWEAEREAITKAYSGRVLEPQMGLLPLGSDPDSGLWEFWHMASGAEPVRGPDGELVVTGETGIVLVLIPGGKFWMGAQKRDPTEETEQHYDPGAGVWESPVDHVRVGRFFLSKYEMTQGQWERTTGSNPSLVQLDMNLYHSPVNPVNQVSWDACTEVTLRLGLELPSEKEWEYAARAGTDTVWWTGDDPQSLQGKVNLQTSSPFPQPSRVIGPVESTVANPWGLHHVLGNVSEWCRNRAHLYGTEPGENPSTYLLRAFRGGNKRKPPREARSAMRVPMSPDFRDPALGLRPARAID